MNITVTAQICKEKTAELRTASHKMVLTSGGNYSEMRKHVDTTLHIKY
jgi:hypothetical protein